MQVPPGRDDRKEHVPADTDEVHRGFRATDVVHSAFFVDRGAEHDRQLELLRPGRLLLLEQVLKHFLLHFVFLVRRLVVRNDLHETNLLLGQLGAFGFGVL